MNFTRRSKKKRRTKASSAVREARSPQYLRPRDPQTLRALADEVTHRTLDAREITNHQQEIHEQMLILSRSMDRPNFNKIGQEDLSRMVRLYDDRFFGGRILPTAMAEGLTFHLSSRMTSVAGKMITNYPNGYDGVRKFELKLSTTLLFQTFEDANRPVEVTGCLCRDRLEAMQRVTEHEMVHLIEMMIWNDGDCNQSRFQSIAKRYFAHSDYRHGLITQRERAAERFDIRVGDEVCFFHDGFKMAGRVNRITRRAYHFGPPSQRAAI